MKIDEIIEHERKKRLPTLHPGSFEIDLEHCGEPLRVIITSSVVNLSHCLTITCQKCGRRCYINKRDDELKMLDIINLMKNFQEYKKDETKHD